MAMTTAPVLMPTSCLTLSPLSLSLSLSSSDSSAALRVALRKALLSAPDAGARLDAEVKGAVNPVTSDIMNQCLGSGLHKAFPLNNFSMMVLSGAKGTQVNHSQICCLLGQQVRTPL
jgi:DNA-directed RNA polymerase I subunit RPA1